VLVFTPPALALHVNVVTPLPLRSVLWPEQTAVGVAVTVSDGNEFTFTVTVAVSEQLPVLPYKVYVVGALGPTLNEAAFDPVLHV
jgi:hypothetical protein